MPSMSTAETTSGRKTRIIRAEGEPPTMGRTGKRCGPAAAADATPISTNPTDVVTAIGTVTPPYKKGLPNTYASKTVAPSTATRTPRLEAQSRKRLVWRELDGRSHSSNVATPTNTKPIALMGDTRASGTPPSEPAFRVSQASP